MINWDQALEEAHRSLADTMTKDETIRLQAAEIDRLRTEVDKCTVVRESLYEALATANKSVAERNAEIERLRDQLRQFTEDRKAPCE